MATPRLDLWAHLEPIVRLRDQRLVAHELLLRPARGPRLDQLASDPATDLTAVTEFALRSAGAVLESSRVPLHVNITPADLTRPGFAVAVIDQVGRDQLPWLVLEITEQTELRPTPQVDATLLDLRRHGVRFAIDDFADGCAGPASVGLVRPEVIKVRLARVAGRHRQRWARRLRELAEVHAADVVVEQVETGEHLRIARRLGFTHGQGWLWSGTRHRSPA